MGTRHNLFKGMNVLSAIKTFFDGEDDKLMCIMRKPAFCIFENKDADQLYLFS